MTAQLRGEDVDSIVGFDKVPGEERGHRVKNEARSAQ